MSFLKNITAKFVTQYLGKYLNGIETDNIKSSWLSGQIELRNLTLKPTALDLLESPIQIKEGICEKVSCKLSWSSIATSPIIIRIQNVDVLLEPKPRCSETVNRADAFLLEQKKALLELASLLYLDQPHHDKKKKDEELKREKRQLKGKVSFLETLQKKMVNNLHFFIDNIHIRYEDLKIGDRRAYTIGFTLKHIQVQTTDANWMPLIGNLVLESVAHKLVQLDNISIYCYTHSRKKVKSSSEDPHETLHRDSQLNNNNHPSKGNVFNESQNDKTPSLSTTIKHPPPLDSFILKPISLTLKIKQQVEPNANEQSTKIILELGQIRSYLNKVQFDTLMQTFHRFNVYYDTAKYLRFRPDFQAISTINTKVKLYWKFAADCIINTICSKRQCWQWDTVILRKRDRIRYVKIWMKFQELGKKKLLSIEMEELDRLQKRYSYDEILIFQRIANAILHKEKKKIIDVDKSKFGHGSDKKSDKKHEHKKDVSNIPSPVLSYLSILEHKEHDQYLKKVYKVDHSWNLNSQQIESNRFSPNLHSTTNTALNRSASLKNADVYKTTPTNKLSVNQSKTTLIACIEGIRLKLFDLPNIESKICVFSFNDLKVAFHTHSEDSFAIFGKIGTIQAYEFHSFSGFVCPFLTADFASHSNAIIEETSHSKNEKPLLVFSFSKDLVGELSSTASQLNLSDHHDDKSDVLKIEAQPICITLSRLFIDRLVHFFNLNYQHHHLVVPPKVILQTISKIKQLGRKKLLDETLNNRNSLEINVNFIAPRLVLYAHNSFEHPEALVADFGRMVISKNRQDPYHVDNPSSLWQERIPKTVTSPSSDLNQWLCPMCHPVIESKSPILIHIDSQTARYYEHFDIALNEITIFYASTLFKIDAINQGAADVGPNTKSRVDLYPMSSVEFNACNMVPPPFSYHYEDCLNIQSLRIPCPPGSIVLKKLDIQLVLAFLKPLPYVPPHLAKTKLCGSIDHLDLRISINAIRILISAICLLLEKTPYSRHIEMIKAKIQNLFNLKSKSQNHEVMAGSQNQEEEMIHSAIANVNQNAYHLITSKRLRFIKMQKKQASSPISYPHLQAIHESHLSSSPTFELHFDIKKVSVSIPDELTNDSVMSADTYNPSVILTIVDTKCTLVAALKSLHLNFRIAKVMATDLFRIHKKLAQPEYAPYYLVKSTRQLNTPLLQFEFIQNFAKLLPMPLSKYNIKVNLPTLQLEFYRPTLIMLIHTLTLYQQEIRIHYPRSEISKSTYSSKEGGNLKKSSSKKNTKIAMKETSSQIQNHDTSSLKKNLLVSHYSLSNPSLSSICPFQEPVITPADSLADIVPELLSLHSIKNLNLLTADHLQKFCSTTEVSSNFKKLSSNPFEDPKHLRNELLMVNAISRLEERYFDEQSEMVQKKRPSHRYTFEYQIDLQIQTLSIHLSHIEKNILIGFFSPLIFFLDYKNSNEYKLNASIGKVSCYGNNIVHFSKLLWTEFKDLNHHDDEPIEINPTIVLNLKNCHSEQSEQASSQKENSLQSGHVHELFLFISRLNLVLLFDWVQNVSNFFTSWSKITLILSRFSNWIKQCAYLSFQDHIKRQDLSAWINAFDSKIPSIEKQRNQSNANSAKGKLMIRIELKDSNLILPSSSQSYDHLKLSIKRIVMVNKFIHFLKKRQHAKDVQNLSSILIEKFNVVIFGCDLRTLTKDCTDSAKPLVYNTVFQSLNPKITIKRSPRSNHLIDKEMVEEDGSQNSFSIRFHLNTLDATLTGNDLDLIANIISGNATEYPFGQNEEDQCLRSLLSMILEMQMKKQMSKAQPPMLVRHFDQVQSSNSTVIPPIDTKLSPLTHWLPSLNQSPRHPSSTYNQPTSLKSRNHVEKLQQQDIDESANMDDDGHLRSNHGPTRFIFDLYFNQCFILYLKGTRPDHVKPLFSIRLDDFHLKSSIFTKGGKQLKVRLMSWTLEDLNDQKKSWKTDLHYRQLLRLITTRNDLDILTFKQTLSLHKASDTKSTKIPTVVGQPLDDKQGILSNIDGLLNKRTMKKKEPFFPLNNAKNNHSGYNVLNSSAGLSNTSNLESIVNGPSHSRISKDDLLLGLHQDEMAQKKMDYNIAMTMETRSQNSPMRIWLKLQDQRIIFYYSSLYNLLTCLFPPIFRLFHAGLFFSKRRYIYLLEQEQKLAREAKCHQEQQEWTKFCSQLDRKQSNLISRSPFEHTNQSSINKPIELDTVIMSSKQDQTHLYIEDGQFLSLLSSCDHIASRQAIETIETIKPSDQLSTSLEPPVPPTKFPSRSVKKFNVQINHLHLGFLDEDNEQQVLVKATIDAKDNINQPLMLSCLIRKAVLNSSILNNASKITLNLSGFQLMKTSPTIDFGLFNKQSPQFAMPQYPTYQKKNAANPVQIIQPLDASLCFERTPDGEYIIQQIQAQLITLSIFLIPQDLRLFLNIVDQLSSLKQILNSIGLPSNSRQHGLLSLSFLSPSTRMVHCNFSLKSKSYLAFSYPLSTNPLSNKEDTISKNRTQYAFVFTINAVRISLCHQSSLSPISITQPLLNIVAKQLDLCLIRNKEMRLNLNGYIQIMGYNQELAIFEPIIEECFLEVLIKHAHKNSFTSMKVESLLNVNVSLPLLETLLMTWKSWKTLTKIRSKNINYDLRRRYLTNSMGDEQLDSSSQDDLLNSPPMITKKEEEPYFSAPFESQVSDNKILKNKNEPPYVYDSTGSPSFGHDQYHPFMIHNTTFNLIKFWVSHKDEDSAQKLDPHQAAPILIHDHLDQPWTPTSQSSNLFSDHQDSSLFPCEINVMVFLCKGRTELLRNIAIDRIHGPIHYYLPSDLEQPIPFVSENIQRGRTKWLIIRTIHQVVNDTDHALEFKLIRNSLHSVIANSTSSKLTTDESLSKQSPLNIDQYPSKTNIDSNPLSFHMINLPHQPKSVPIEYLDWDAIQIRPVPTGDDPFQWILCKKDVTSLVISCVNMAKTKAWYCTMSSIGKMDRGFKTKSIIFHPTIQVKNTCPSPLLVKWIFPAIKDSNKINEQDTKMDSTQVFDIVESGQKRAFYDFPIFKSSSFLLTSSYQDIRNLENEDFSQQIFKQRLSLCLGGFCWTKPFFLTRSLLEKSKLYEHVFNIESVDHISYQLLAQISNPIYGKMFTMMSMNEMTDGIDTVTAMNPSNDLGIDLGPSFKLTFFFRYWIVNQTGLKLNYALNLEKSSFFPDANIQPCSLVGDPRNWYYTDDSVQLRVNEEDSSFGAKNAIKSCLPHNGRFQYRPTYWKNLPTKICFSGQELAIQIIGFLPPQIISSLPSQTPNKFCKLLNDIDKAYGDASTKSPSSKMENKTTLFNALQGSTVPISLNENEDKRALMMRLIPLTDWSQSIPLPFDDRQLQREDPTIKTRIHRPMIEALVLHDLYQQRHYELCCKFEQASGKFWRTTQIFIKPQYMLVNELGHHLSYRQVETSYPMESDQLLGNLSPDIGVNNQNSIQIDESQYLSAFPRLNVHHRIDSDELSNPYYKLLDGDQVPWHGYQDRPKSLMINFVDSLMPSNVRQEPTFWSGPFCIDQLGDFLVKIRYQLEPMNRFKLIHVSIKQSKRIKYVIFRPAPQDYLPHLLVENLTKFHLLIQQIIPSQKNSKLDSPQIVVANNKDERKKGGSGGDLMINRPLVEASTIIKNKDSTPSNMDPLSKLLIPSHLERHDLVKAKSTLSYYWDFPHLDPKGLTLNLSTTSNQSDDYKLTNVFPSSLTLNHISEFFSQRPQSSTTYPNNNHHSSGPSSQRSLENKLERSTQRFIFDWHLTPDFHLKVCLHQVNFRSTLSIFQNSTSFLHHDSNQLEDSTCSSFHTNGHKEEKIPLSFDIELPLIGISIINSSPKEIFYIYLQDIKSKVELIGSGSHYRYSLSIKKGQIYNQLDHSCHPLLLNGLPHQPKISNLEDCFLSLLLNLDKNQKRIKKIHLFFCQLQPFQLNLDPSTILITGEFFSQIVQLFKCLQLNHLSRYKIASDGLLPTIKNKRLGKKSDAPPSRYYYLRDIQLDAIRIVFSLINYSSTPTKEDLLPHSSLMTRIRLMPSLMTILRIASIDQQSLYLLPFTLHSTLSPLSTILNMILIHYKQAFKNNITSIAFNYMGNMVRSIWTPKSNASVVFNHINPIRLPRYFPLGNRLASYDYNASLGQALIKNQIFGKGTKNNEYYWFHFNLSHDQLLIASYSWIMKFSSPHILSSSGINDGSHQGKEEGGSNDQRALLWKERLDQMISFVLQDNIQSLIIYFDVVSTDEPLHIREIQCQTNEQLEKVSKQLEMIIKTRYE